MAGRNLDAWGLPMRPRKLIGQARMGDGTTIVPPFESTRPEPPEGPPNTVERDATRVAAALAIGVALLLIFLLGCSARLGPGEYGWMMWDVCGYEGGVAASITIMEIGARLGCTNPAENGDSEPVVNPDPITSNRG